MGAVIERVWRAGGTFQEWSERFDLSLWEEALAAEGLSLRRGGAPDRDRARAAALGPHLGRSAPRLPVDGLAGRPGRGGHGGGLPLDPLLRLRGLHRVRAGARGGLAGARRPAAARARAGPGRGGPPVPVRLVRGTVPGRRPDGGAGCASGSPRPGKIRFTSHRDVARMWERALRRSRLPVAFSQGFSPTRC
jgi:hypothetical protein